VLAKEAKVSVNPPAVSTTEEIMSEILNKPKETEKQRSTKSTPPVEKSK
jgi:hypothetical protein